MYADDSLIHTRGHIFDHLKEKLNSDLQNLSNWDKAIKMAINNDQTKYMLITSDNKWATDWSLEKCLFS